MINSYYIFILQRQVELSQILYIVAYVEIALIKQLIRRKLARASKRTTLYDYCWTNKLNYKRVWVDINQVNITYENRSKHLISF